MTRSSNTDSDVFLDHVADAYLIYGGSAPSITDYIMKELYSFSSYATRSDGNYSSLRRGVMDKVRRILKTQVFSIWSYQNEHERYLFLAAREILSNIAYYVPHETGGGQYFDIPSLCLDPDNLERSIKYLKNKSDEINRETYQMDLLLRMIRNTPDFSVLFNRPPQPERKT